MFSKTLQNLHGISNFGLQNFHFLSAEFAKMPCRILEGLIYSVYYTVIKLTCHLRACHVIMYFIMNSFSIFIQLSRLYNVGHSKKPQTKVQGWADTGIRSNFQNFGIRIFNLVSGDRIWSRFSIPIFCKYLIWYPRICFCL